jgi:hypothetical protein
MQHFKPKNTLQSQKISVVASIITAAVKRVGYQTKTLLSLMMIHDIALMRK